MWSTTGLSLLPQYYVKQLEHIIYRHLIDHLGKSHLAANFCVILFLVKSCLIGNNTFLPHLFFYISLVSDNIIPVKFDQ